MTAEGRAAMSHRHYCGCGQSWRCVNESCTEDDICLSCATALGQREDAIDLEGIYWGGYSRREEE